MSYEEFWDKHRYWGIEQQNFLEIRFYPETNVLVQLKKILSREEEYFVLPIESNRNIYRGKIDIIDQLFNDHARAHFTVVDTKFNWILIKNEFNKLIGVGDQMKRKNQKKIRMAFDSERIMYSTTD